MKYSFFLLLLLVVSPGCDHCANVDCVPAGTDMFFRLIDNSGKDLFADLKVPQDQVVLTTGDGTKLTYYQYSSKAMAVALPPEVSTLKFTYNDRIATLILETVKVSDGVCCGPRYAITGVTASTSITAERDTNNNDVFVIKI